MAPVQLTSLRTRFLALIALGGSIVASGGLWVTYTATVGHFEAQFVQQVKLLASSLNHSAMVADTSKQVQHIVDQLSVSPHVTNIVVALKEPPGIMASSNQSWVGTRLDRLPDRHLGEHLLETMAQGNFGHHFDYEGDTLILTIPLEPRLSNHQGHGGSVMPSGTAQEQSKIPEHGATQEHGKASEHGPRHDIEPTTAHDRSSYRGVIMLVLDNKGASAASSQILWLLCTALIAAVLIMMLIAYVIVNRQILDRLTVIRRAMIAQDSSANAMPIPVSANDEISDLGRTFNSMIDRIDAETKRRENAVKELKDSEERFRSIVDNSPTKIHIKDIAGRFVLVNKVYEKLFGASEQEILGKTADEIFPDQSIANFVAHDQAVLDSGQTIELEEQWEWDDCVHTYLTVKFPIRDADGEIKAIGSIGTDITERKATEETVLAAMKEAQSADRAKTEFLANMSHELRTPLNSVIGFSEIIKDEKYGPLGNTQYLDYAVHINESGQHLLSLINDILDLSKVEFGTDELHEENVDIPDIVHSIMKLLTGVAQTGNVDLVFDIPDGIPALRADGRKLKQILLNLLSNAIKYTLDGGKVTLKVWSSAENGYVFQVIDTGIGIAFEDIPKALAPFQQIDGGLNRKHGGTGLGLPLTKSLVELHGGYLDLQSDVGIGTTVTVRFPAERIVILPRNTGTLDTANRKAG